MRARIDVSEIEAQTKIRAKYLRALENEEWSLLPGPTFVKSFLRTYAQALGLDGKALVEEYRLNHEQPGEGALEPIVSAPTGSRRSRPPSGPSRGYVAAVVGIAVLIVVLVVLLISGGRLLGQEDRHHLERRQAQLACSSRAQHHTRAHERSTRGDLAVAACERGGVRVPARRRRPQADPRHRTAAG